MVESSGPGPSGRWIGAACAGLLLLGLALRGMEAAKSLWLDELHTLDVASAPDPGAVIERIKPDFHAPLFFVAAHVVRACDPRLQRGLALLAGLLAVLPLLGLARAARLAPEAVLALLGTFLLLPFQIQYGVELRPYAWLGLASLTLVWAAFTTRASARVRTGAFVAATALGLLTHYLVAVVVVGVGAVRLFVRGPGLLSWRRLVLAGTVGVFVFLPWVLTVESWIFTDPGVMFRVEAADQATATAPASPVAPAVSRGELLSVPARLLVPGVGTLGGLATRAAQLGLVLMGLVAAVSGVLVLARPRRTLDLGPGLLGAMVAGALITLLLVGASLKVWHRVAIQYFAATAWVWPLVFGLLIHAYPTDRARRVAAAVLLLGALVAGIGHATGAPREDLREAVRIAAAVADREDAILTAVMRQPQHYSHVEIYRAYQPGRTFVEPQQVPDGAAAKRPVVVLARRAGPTDAASRVLFRTIARGRRLARAVVVDEALSVLVFTPE